jgi:hypothetical protein
MSVHGFPHSLIDETTVNASRNGATGWIFIESLRHTVGGYFLELVGQIDVDPEGELLEPRIVLKPWIKHSYFDEINELRPITTREARQMAHVLLALAEEVDGWTVGVAQGLTR